MTRPKKKFTADLNKDDIVTVLASLQTSIGRVQSAGVKDQQTAQVLANLYGVRDKILASIGTTYEAYEQSWDGRTDEVAT